MNLTVEREGGYRVESIVYADGRRVGTASRTVEGVGSLRPEYARSGVRFYRFGATDIPPAAFSVDSAGENRTELDVTALLTNAGGDPPDARGVQLLPRRGSVRDGVIVDAVRVVASLDPTENVSVNATRRSTELSVSDFERDGTSDPERMSEPTAADAERETATDGPGFGALEALATLLVAVGAVRRWSA